MGDIDIQVQPDIDDPDLIASPKPSSRRGRRSETPARRPPRTPSPISDDDDSSSDEESKFVMPSGDAARIAEQTATKAAETMTSSFYSVKTIIIVAVVVTILCILGYVAYRWFSHKPEVVPTAAVAPPAARPVANRPPATRPLSVNPHPSSVGSPGVNPHMSSPHIVSGQVPMPSSPAPSPAPTTTPTIAPTHESLVNDVPASSLLQSLAAINAKKMEESVPEPEPESEEISVIATVMIVEAADGAADGTSDSLGGDGQPKVQEVGDEAAVAPPAVAPQTSPRCSKILDNHRQCAKRSTVGGRCHFHQGS